MGEKIISYDRSAFREQSHADHRHDQPHIRKVAAINEKGEVFIDNHKNSSPAKLALAGPAHLGDAALTIGGEVLVVYENADPEKPIIIGAVSDRLGAGQAAATSLIEENKEIFFKGKQILFESSGEIVIKCGHSTIQLKNNGQIILRGKEIISRAAKCNKIKGSSVKIN